MIEKRVQTTFKLDEPVKVWLAEKAKRNDRSSNKQLNFMLRKQMEQEQSQQESRQEIINTTEISVVSM